MVTAAEILKIAQEKNDISKYMEKIDEVLTQNASQLAYGMIIKHKVSDIPEYLIPKIKETLITNGFSVNDGTIATTDYRGERDVYKTLEISILKK